MSDEHREPTDMEQPETTPEPDADAGGVGAPVGSGYFGPESAVSGGVDPIEAAGGQRLSMMAAGSLGLVFVSIVLGCGGLVGSLVGLPVSVGVFLGPAIGLLASAMAFIALRRILTSGGVLMGRFAALLALFVGVGVTTLTGFTAIAALLTASASKSLAPIVSDVAIGAQTDRRAMATLGLSEAARRELDDAALARFGDLLEQELGTVTGVGAGIDLIGGSRRVLAESPGAEFVTDVDMADLPRPVWLEFERADGTSGRVIAYVSTDLFDREAELADAAAAEEAGEGDGGDDDAVGEELPPGDGGEGGVRPFTEAREAAVIVSDIAVMVGPNRVVLLREDGPMAELASTMGWEVVRSTDR